MSQYSKPSDFKNARFQKIGVQWHDAAEAQFDALFMYPNGFDPSDHWDSFNIPPIVELWCQWKTVELWARDRAKEDGDAMDKQATFAGREVRAIEPRITRGLLVQTTDVDYSDPPRRGMSGRIFRA